LRVFIASDDDTFRRVASFLLRRRGFAIDESDTLPFACLREQVGVDVILLDDGGPEAGFVAWGLREWLPGAAVIVLKGDACCDKWARLVQAADDLISSRLY
jgi:hypothetical protein